MNEKTKESKFLDAINKYAEKQKATISTEVEEYKNQRIEQATEQGLKDAYDLIQHDITRRKSSIVTEMSAKEHELRTRQFTKRQQISDEVFAKAKKKLIEFTDTVDYAAYLQKSAEEVKALFGDSAVAMLLSKKDMQYAEVVKTILPDAEIKEDNTIRIGGIKAYSKAKGILADNTLDTKLEDQREWFIENSELKVV